MKVLFTVPVVFSVSVIVIVQRPTGGATCFLFIIPAQLLFKRSSWTLCQIGLMKNCRKYQKRIMNPNNKTKVSFFFESQIIK